MRSWRERIEAAIARLGLRQGVTSTLQTMVASGFVLVLNLGTGIIAARVLGPEGRGVLAAIILWPQFLTYCVTFGVPTAIIYNMKRWPGETARYVAVAVILGSVSGLLSAVLGVLLIPLWMTEYDEQAVRFAQYLMALGPVLAIHALFLSVMRGRETFRLWNVLRLILPLMTLIVLVALMIGGWLDPFTGALAYTVVEIPAMLIAGVILVRDCRIDFRLDRAFLRRLASYAIRSYAVDLLGTLGMHLHRVLLIGLINPAAMGLYVVAANLTRPLKIIDGSLLPVLFPKASGRSQEAVVELVGSATRVAGGATALAAVGLIGIAPWALGILYGEAFLEAVPAFRILVLETVVSGYTAPLAQAFMALGRPGLVAITQAAGQATVLPLLFVLAPLYGLEGAAIALLASAVVRLVFVIACYPLQLGVRPPWLLVTVADIRRLRKPLTGEESGGGTAGSGSGDGGRKV